MPFRSVLTFLDLNLIAFFKLYGFSIIGKTFFITLGAKPNLTLNISTASFCSFVETLNSNASKVLE